VLKAQSMFEGEETPRWMHSEGGLVECSEGSLRGISTFGGRAEEKARALGRVSKPCSGLAFTMLPNDRSKHLFIQNFLLPI